MAEEVIVIAENEKCAINMGYVSPQKVRVSVIVKGALDRLADFIRTDVPWKWQKTDTGYSILCTSKGAAEESVGHAEYALKECGTKLKRRQRPGSTWRQLVKREKRKH